MKTTATVTRTVRKPGQRNPAIGKEPEVTVSSLLIGLLKFVRTDFGGKNQDVVISERLKKDGVQPSPDAIAAYKCGANNTRDTIRNYLKPQVGQIKAIFGI